MLLKEVATVRALRRLGLLEDFNTHRSFFMRHIEMLACTSTRRVLLSAGFHGERGVTKRTPKHLKHRAPVSPYCSRKLLQQLKNFSIRSEMVAMLGVTCADKHTDTKSLTTTASRCMHR